MYTHTGGYVHLYRRICKLVPADRYTCTETSLTVYRGNSEVLLRIQAARDAVSFGTFRSGVVPPATESCSLSNCPWTAVPCTWGSDWFLALCHK